MSYTIGSDMHIYTADGRKLPRTEVAALVDQINAQLSRPVHIYLMGDMGEDVLKVGIAENVEKRRRENEYDCGFKLQTLHVSQAMDKVSAIEVERGIHNFLRKLKSRGPIYKNEYFQLWAHDVWLIRTMLTQMPLKAARAIFDSLTNEYVALLHQYETSPDFVREEVRLQFGENILYHFNKEVEEYNYGGDEDTKPYTILDNFRRAA